MTSNANDFASDAKTDTITDSPTNAASRAKQNTIPDGLSSKSSPHPANGASGVSALQTITSRAVRQHVIRQVLPDAGIHNGQKEKKADELRISRRKWCLTEENKLLHSSHTL